VEIRKKSKSADYSSQLFNGDFPTSSVDHTLQKLFFLESGFHAHVDFGAFLFSMLFFIKKKTDETINKAKSDCNDIFFFFQNSDCVVFFP
jgi:hypothetical protein